MRFRARRRRGWSASTEKTAGGTRPWRGKSGMISSAPALRGRFLERGGAARRGGTKGDDGLLRGGRNRRGGSTATAAATVRSRASQAEHRTGERGKEEGSWRGQAGVLDVVQDHQREETARHGRTSRGMAPVKRRGRGADREGPHVRDLDFSRFPFPDF